MMINVQGYVLMDWVMCDFLINSVVVCLLGGVVEGSGMHGGKWMGLVT